MLKRGEGGGKETWKSIWMLLQTSVEKMGMGHKFEINNDIIVNELLKIGRGGRR